MRPCMVPRLQAKQGPKDVLVSSGHAEEGLSLPPLSLLSITGKEHVELPDDGSPLRLLVAELRNEDDQEHTEAESHTQRQ